MTFPTSLRFSEEEIPVAERTLAAAALAVVAEMAVTSASVSNPMYTCLIYHRAIAFLPGPIRRLPMDCQSLSL